MQTLYLVDASMYVFRAWHSMPDEFHDADGWPTNAVHGFAPVSYTHLDVYKRQTQGEGVRKPVRGTAVQPSSIAPVRDGPGNFTIVVTRPPTRPVNVPGVHAVRVAGR